MDKKWWLLYCRRWKRNKEYEERVLLIVVVVIDCGVSTTVNTTILLIYILIYIMFNFCLLKNPWKSWWWWCVSNQSGTHLRICPRPCWIQWLKKIIYVLPKVFEKNGPKQYVRGGIPSFYWGTLYNWASRRDSEGTYIQYGQIWYGYNDQCIHRFHNKYLRKNLYPNKF